MTTFKFLWHGKAGEWQGGQGLNVLVLAALSLTAVGCGSRHKQSPAPAPPPPNSLVSPIVSPLKYYNHFPFNNVYTLNIELGGQPLETVLDTGSSNLLAIGDGTHCTNCQDEYGYNSTYSPSANAKELDTAWSMNFAPIGSAQVQGYQDTVGFAGQTLNDFHFGLVTAEQGIPNIWGIAYEQLAHHNGDVQVPLFDALVAATGLKNQFSMSLCALKKGSSVTLGGFDPAFASNMSQVQWTPIVEKIWYTIKVTRMYVDGVGGAAPAWLWTLGEGSSLIVDSGTNPLVLPAETIGPLVTLLSSVATKAGMNIPATFWPTAKAQSGFIDISDTDIGKFPPLSLDVVSGDDPSKVFTLSIAPSTYFQTREDGKRYLGIQAGPPATYILGTVFMENYAVLHDRGTLEGSSIADSTARIGFYPASGLCN